MERRMLGRTGVSVSKMCLGAMMFGTMGNKDHDDCARIIHHTLDAGINFIDTADAYCTGANLRRSSPRRLKEADDVSSSPRSSSTTMKSDPTIRRRAEGGDCRSTTKSKTSLRRLDTDYIDLCNYADPPIRC